KYSALIKYLSEPGRKVIMQKAENHYMSDQQKDMPFVDEELYFTIDEKNNTVDLTDKGIHLITQSGEDPEFFIMPDVGASIAEIEKSGLSAEDKLAKKDVLLKDFAIKSERIHSVQQLLKAYTLFEKDVEYVVLDGKVKIVDEQTGRILEGRRYSDGLHQAIEARENVRVEAATQTFATITLQNYFRMYHKLAGMTGTASTESAEFWEIYKLDVVSIPTNLPMVRDDEHDLVYKTKREKYRAVIDQIEKYRTAGRPVLVGTTSVEVSELLSRMLTQKKIPHNVLNAKQHQREAQIVAEAGLSGNVTIATNMAGRGTDIKLGAGVKEAGGLAIIGTERHESRRVDNQLRGRAGRQGDPGTSQFYASLEDDLMRMFGSDRIASLMDKMGYKEGEVIQHSMISKSIERAQKKVEENNFGIRKRLLDYDDVMNLQRNVIYGKRNHALFGERLSIDLDNSFYDVAENLVFNHKESNNYDEFRLDVMKYLGVDTTLQPGEFEADDVPTIAQHLYTEALESYRRKNKALVERTFPVIRQIYKEQGGKIENISVPFTDGMKGINVLAPLKKIVDTSGQELVTSLEKGITLALIDESWKEHLRQMDDLKQSVQSASYEQKDPLVIYKIEAFNLFRVMNTDTNKEIVAFLTKAGIPVAENNNNNNNNGQIREGHEEKTDMSRMKTRKEAYATAGGDSYEHDEDYYASNSPAKKEPIRVGPKVGRNDPCPCGSGKKYKHCHGKEE
ncbi:MAG TPA: SEC-C metal-binding domain-containing protein, partial [Chitinophagaceae bacterium]|nr:SEC-C metal-binding domain-containing protein [Chitinophagaceae bacterium]